MVMYGFIGERTRAPQSWRREKRRASEIFALLYLRVKS